MIVRTLLLLALAAPAWAATLVPIGNSATLTTTAITAPGRTPNNVSTMRGVGRLAIDITGTAGTMNADVEVSCDGTTWTDVAGLTGITAIGPRLVGSPICFYSVNFNTCNTGCSVNVTAYVIHGD